MNDGAFFNDKNNIITIFADFTSLSCVKYFFMRTIRLLLTFYKLFAATSITISLTCCIFVYVYKMGISSYAAFFWIKIVTLVVIFYYIHKNKKNEFYYYKNLGLTKKRLWISTLTFDYILFLILFTITIHL